MIVIKWYGAYLIEDGEVKDSYEFPDERLEEILKALSSGNYEPVQEFLERYPGEEIVVKGDLKNQDKLHELMMRISREKMSEVLGEDYILVQTLAAYDDIITTLNLMSERVTELERIEAIKNIVLEEAESMREQIKSMTALRDSLASSIKIRAEQIAPNLTAVVGDIVAARLISYAGGLGRLARMPSSTIQVLGAEDSFFQHLKKGTPCPKHGIIFQVFEVRNLPPKKRGKAARALAGKLAIAARVDYYKGEFVGDRLKDEFKARVEEIKNDSDRTRG